MYLSKSLITAYFIFFIKLKAENQLEF